jgi:hypothetical protein
MYINIAYKFTAPVWKHSSTGGWYFVSLPIESSEEIRQNMKWQEEGWGRMKAKAKIRESLRKSGDSIKIDQISAKVTPEGF